MPLRRSVSLPGLRGGVTVLTLVAAVIVVFELWTAVSHTLAFAQVGYQNLRGPRHLVRDADLDPLSYFAPTEALVAATRIIPRDATYTVRVGNEEPSPPTQIVDDIFKLWLVPRRYVPSLADAQWAITYNKSSESLGVGYSKELGLGPGVNADKLVHGGR
jgi:hypothetical protein